MVVTTTGEGAANAMSDCMREKLFTGTAALLLLIAVVLLALRGDELEAANWPVALMLFMFALFCINSGFSLPGQGYVSFDRVAQVASILVLGPVPAAAINGLASLIFPLRRLAQGQSWRQVSDSCMANAGMMSLLVLASGSLYQWAGGEVPLLGVSAANLPALFLMGVCLHSLNELCMAGFMYLRTGRAGLSMDVFGYAVELFGIVMGVLVAAVLPVLPQVEFVLLMIVMAVGMVVLRELAELRMSLSDKVAQRTQELEEKTAALNDLARRDSLTELLNRRAMDAWLEDVFACTDAPRLTVALLDIDHFKSVNDEHSHALGDAVLCEVARLIGRALEPSDVAARFGGDEFLLAFAHADAASVARRCKGLIIALREQGWGAESPELRVTASMGAATREDGDTPRQLIARADRRLYAAKQSGRNRLCFDT